MFLPITSVTVLEDRAQVTRSGQVELAAGAQRLRIGPVTALAVDRSLRAEVSAGTVVDARIVRTSAPVLPSEEDSPVRRLTVDLTKQRDVLLQRRQRAQARLELVQQAKADVRRDITENAGAGSAEPERWAAQTDAVETAEAAAAETLRSLDSELSALNDRLREARTALQRTESEPGEVTAMVEVVVEAAGAGAVDLRVTHLVPCALWRPAYRARLSADLLQLECDAMVWQSTGEEWTDVRLSFSTARPTLATRPPSLVDDVLNLRDRTVDEKKTVDVDLREEEISSVGRSVAHELPGVDDGGEVRVLAAPSPVTVPSDGRPHRVLLSSFDAKCRVEHACVPELSPLVTQVAYAANESGHVLLAGPVDLIRDSGFVGRGRLKFTASGEELRLPFGSEDTFRVVRDVTETRDSGTFSGRTVISRTVTLFLSHLGTTPAEVVLRERIPVSEVSAVTVRLREDACSPAVSAADDQGIVRWDLRVEAGARQKVVLAYEITASGKVSGL